MLEGSWKTYVADVDKAGFAEPFGAYAPTHRQSLLIALAQKTFLHRGSFRQTMFRLIQGRNGKPIDIRFRGCAFRLFGDGNLIEYGLLLHPNYNSADIDFLLEGSQPGANFVDIGSNIGLYALPMAAHAAPSGGKMVAIDANPLVCARLAFNAESCRLDNISIFAEGVSDRESRAGLSRRKDDLAIVRIEEGADGSIPVRSLASFLDEAGIDCIHGLKIDIEGHEDKALVPFFETQPESCWPNRIVIETAGDGNDYPGCTAAFRRCGYHLAGRTRQNSLYRRG